MRSGKSFAAHLSGMYAVLEAEDPLAINEAVQRWLNGPKALDRPIAPPAGKRGSLTIVDVSGAEDAEEHVERVRKWASATWKAWSTFHALAKEWIDQALRESPNG